MVEKAVRLLKLFLIGHVTRSVIIHQKTKDEEERKNIGIESCFLENGSVEVFILRPLQEIRLSN